MRGNEVLIQRGAGGRLGDQKAICDRSLSRRPEPGQPLLGHGIAGTKGISHGH